MKNLFIGFIFIFLNFNIESGSSSIALIPDFVGFYFMITGLKELIKESYNFEKMQPLAGGMTIFTFIIFIMDILGIKAKLGAISFVISFILVIVSFYLTYSIIMGIVDMEINHSIDLYSQKLLKLCIIIFGLKATLPVLLAFANLAFISYTALLVATIMFLVTFNQAKKIYESVV